MGFLKKHCGVILFSISVIMAILAPIIFTNSKFECFLETGQIGDTIGGTTAPFWGFLSVILLYLALKEQQDFNKVQRTSNDYEILTKLRLDISNLSKNISIYIINNTSGVISRQGISYIEELRKSTHPDNSIQEKDFDHLYKSVVEIAELCFLYHGILKESSLYNSSKNSFFNAITIHLENIRHLFHFYEHKEINIIPDSNTTVGDIWKRYVNNKDLLTKIDAIRNERF